MPASCFNHILLTGPPGCGKTTVIQKICQILSKRDISFDGFYTQENRENGVRCGFDAINVKTNHRCVLARTLGSSAVKGPRVGRYVVNVKSFESVAQPFFDNIGTNPQILLIDEIGKMELFSKYFEDSVADVLRDGNQHIVIATVPINRTNLPFVERICSAKSSKIVMVNNDNRNSLPEQISEEVIKIHKERTK